jgi:hypothetical protein
VTRVAITVGGRVTRAITGLGSRDPRAISGHDRVVEGGRVIRARSADMTALSRVVA